MDFLTITDYNEITGLTITQDILDKTVTDDTLMQIVEEQVTKVTNNMSIFAQNKISKMHTEKSSQRSNKTIKIKTSTRGISIKTSTQNYSKGIENSLISYLSYSVLSLNLAMTHSLIHRHLSVLSDHSNLRFWPLENNYNFYYFNFSVRNPIF